MKSGITKFGLSVLFLSVSFTLSAQSGSGSSSNYLLVGIAVVAALIILGVVLQVADNLMRIEARQSGADKSGANYSLFPQMGEIFKPSLPDYTTGHSVNVLTKGHDILLQGAANGTVDTNPGVTTYAIKPQEFIGISPIPKMVVAVGDTVKAGDPLFFDKKRPEIMHVAPVSGEIIEINRGDRRSIVEVVILGDKEIQYKSLEPVDLSTASREDLVAFLQESGVWSSFIQRPYDIIADPSDDPKAIFISTFDTAPLAPDLNKVVEGKQAAFQKGLDVLKHLTSGTVHLGLSANGDIPPSSVFTDARGVEKHWFKGKHPAGNVGVQIHHIDPINAQDKVWIMNVQAVITLGKLFTEKRYDATRVIAVTGAEINQPKYVVTHIGAKISDLINNNLTNDHVRFVSGDVLSGTQVSKDSYLSFYDDQLTVLEEGDEYELFGWLLPIAPRPTVSNTFPNFLYPDLKFRANTNTHGEERAFVVTGQYEEVLPMDIYLQHLMKSILINDFEKMEGLGIYELSEEDVALAEFVCTSKQPLQRILRQGLDTMREQG